MITIARIIAAVLIALTLGAGTANADEPTTAGPVVGVDVETATDETIEQLKALDFYGDPTDSCECLYAPASVFVEDAPQWIVDMLADNGYVGDPNDGAEMLYIAPATSPDGFTRTTLWEDGSAEYGNSTYYFAADTMSFEPVSSL